MTDPAHGAGARTADHGPVGAALAADLAAASLALARRLHTGATLWCCAPTWPAHARHVAVEFVHPVVVGTRALPAVAVGGPDPVGAVRGSSSPGDVVLAVGPAHDPVLARLLPRARAWGLESIWVGAGPRPPMGSAGHVLWLGDEVDAESAPHDGSLVLLYHLLWELTHVCFEHPGLLRPVEGGEQVCTTCADEGRPGEVVADGPDGALVRTAEGTELVDVTLVGPVDPGDLVLVHAGTAITRWDVGS